MSKSIVKIKDCWNEKGVWGSQSEKCEKLSQVIHCRNCEVFEQAARGVLEAKLPSGYRQSWTKIYRLDEQEGGKELISGIVFRVQKEWFFLSAACFDKVAKIRPIHKIPHNKDGYILGFVNIDGAIRVCFSISALLGMPLNEAEAGLSTAKVFQRFIVTRIEGGDFVFQVDEVRGLERFEKGDMAEAPLPYQESLKGGVKAVIDSSFGMLNVLDPYSIHQLIEAGW